MVMDPEIERKLAEYDVRRRRIEKIVMLVLMIVLFTLLTVEASLFEFRTSFPVPFNLIFFILLNVNVILIFTLLFLVFRNIAKLLFERKASVLGSKLRTKLIVAFTTFALAPTIVFFYVALTFITNSIDRWFSIQVEASLSESLEVAQTYYKAFEESAIYFADQLAEGVSQRAARDELQVKFPNAVLEDFLEERQNEYHLDAVDVYVKPESEARFVAGQKLPSSALDKEQKKLLAAGWKGESASQTFELGEGETVWGMAPITVSEEIQGVVVVRYQIPQSLLGRMRSIVGAYEEYTQLQMIEGPIKTSYVIILVLITCFIFFSAIWFGFLLSRNMVGPLQKLAAGTKRLAEGDLTVRLQTKAGDEFGTLVDSFNAMTERLSESRQALVAVASELRESNVELDRRSAYMETVLANITAGVISFDEEERISTVNASARVLLAIENDNPVGCPAREILSDKVLEHITQVRAALRRNPQRTVMRQVEFNVAGRARVLLMSMTLIMEESGKASGAVLVVEDLSDLVKAQRMSAWQEVARRIAHEIKNPLTPIQLAAQRLRKRYANRFGEEDNKVFLESTATIVKQVDDMKKLVDEFSNFARMAVPHPAFHDVNEVLNEAIVLYSEAHKNILFRFDRDDALPRLYCDRDQVKRVFINLIDNAVASIAKRGNIRVQSRYNEKSKAAVILIEDNGCGLPVEYEDRLFEPYFSTKKMGTGLGLAIVHQIVTDMEGSIRLESNEPAGTRVRIEFPVRNVGEVAESKTPSGG